MALIVKDRVKQQTTTTGSTDAYVLSGSFTGFDAFTEIGDGNETYYCCTDGTDFEVGRGTFTASGTTLSRAEILSSSNSDAEVNWTSGTRTIFCTQPADKAVFLDAGGHINLPDSTAPNYDNRLRFGAGSDLQIFSDGTHGYMQGAGNNDLTVAFDEVKFLSQDYSTERLHITSAGNVEMSNGSEFMAKFIANGACELYHDDSLKFNTTSLGTKSTGIHVVEHASGFGAVEIGGPSGGHIDLKAPNSDDYDFRIIHAGSSGESAIIADDLHFKSFTGEENYIDATLNGAVNLYYDNNLRLTTTTDGVKVTGGTGDATLTLEADTDNSNESDNPTLVLSQDGGTTVSKLRLNGVNDTILEAHSNGDLFLQSSTGENYFKGVLDGGVELYYDNGERLTTASSGIVTTSPVLTNQGTTGDARALFTHTIVGNNPTNVQYAKIATLPTTSNATLDHLTLEGQVGGWLPTTQGYFKISFGRRNGFSYLYDAYGDIQTIAAIQAYQQADGTVQIWGKFNSLSYTKLSYSIPHSFQVTIEENPSLTTTAPSGTLVFDTSSSTYAPRFQVDNAGNLSATTKSFDIAHPTKENMRLRYGSLEGPENGVYVRGRLTGSSVIELPEHWSGLVDEDSITVQLTAIGKSQDLWVEDVSIEQVKVCDANTDCFYMVMAERIDVAKLEVEYAN